MITLDEYKTHLINVYRYKIDNNAQKLKERISKLEDQYNDTFLQKVINNTYDFIYDIFNSKTLSYGYCMFPLEYDTTSHISLNLTGGFFSDTLFVDDKNRVISKYILESIFGNKFIIGVKEEEIPFETDDEDIISYNYAYALYMQGFPDNMEKIKENLFGKTKTKRLIKS